MKISEIMTGKVISIDRSEPVTAAAALLKRYNIGALPVTDGEMRLLGLVTDRDIVLRCVAAGADARAVKVGDIMSRGIATLAPGDLAENAAQLMSRDQVRRIPVVQDGRLVGMVALCDLARGGVYSMETADALTEITAGIKRK